MDTPVNEGTLDKIELRWKLIELQAALASASIRAREQKGKRSVVNTQIRDAVALAGG